MSDHALASYVRELKPLLQRGTFAPARSRLWWLPVHLIVIGAGFLALAQRGLPALIQPIISLLIGGSFAGLTFLAHETLHGAVVRHARLRYLVGAVGFLPFMVSPRLWIAWHNRVHHGNTQHAERDPDAYPTLLAYRQSLALRVASQIAPGRRRLRGFLSTLLGFSVQSAHVLIVARKRGYLSPRQHGYAILETLLGATLWLSLALGLGGRVAFFGIALPLMVANVVVMSFILTNHCLSPLTEVNDPLANSLSVTLPRLLEWLTLGFGYHVEHHLFPVMSARHAPSVRALLLARWPERYQSMTVLSANAALYRSPRIYKTSTTLVDPDSGIEWPTLAPSVPMSEHEKHRLNLERARPHANARAD